MILGQRPISAAIILLIAQGCAYSPEVNGPPVYWTETGAGEYEELGRISGSTFGYCLTDDGIYWAAVQDAIREAQAMGADGVLLPNSMAAGSTFRPGYDCNWLLQIFLLPGSWFDSVDVVAIKRKGEK